LVRTGDTFKIVMSNEEAPKFKRAIDIQWALTQIAAMSGAAEPVDLDGSEDESDGGFGELAIALKVAESLDEVERPMVRMPLRPLPPQSSRTPTRGRSPTTYNPPSTIGGT
jgi:hypothetical protein